MDPITIFICQFICVYMLGVQSLMVRDANCQGAAMGSFLIGISQFYIFGIIGGLSADDINTLPFWAFILAGPSAIVNSIKTHPLLNEYVFKRKAKNER